jgi:hypothetical protein
MRLNDNKVSIGTVDDELSRLRNRLTTSKTERPEVIEESIFHISRFAKASIAELGSSRIKTLGLPVYLSTTNSKGPKSNYCLPSSAIARLNFLLLPPDRIWVRREA